jgi:dihydroxyacid dehydratase/phosphogluconate dehydratase
MQPPDALIRKGIRCLPTIGDGRQSGTADAPSIVHATPEAAAGGGLSWLRSGDIIRIDITNRRCDALVAEDEIERRRKADPTPVIGSATPWEAIYRSTVGSLKDGACIEDAVGFRGVSSALPRHNH